MASGKQLAESTSFTCRDIMAVYCVVLVHHAQLDIRVPIMPKLGCLGCESAERDQGDSVSDAVSDVSSASCKLMVQGEDSLHAVC